MVPPMTVVPGMAPADGGTLRGGEEPLPNPKKDDGKKSEVPTRARLIVEVPADAKLYIDGQQMKTTSAVRSFHTPELEPGQLYYYEVKAEVVRDGKATTQTKRVIVKAGEVIRARFPGLETEGVANAR
jgi:uncharacterized protein (TIGR03000 family)